MKHGLKKFNKKGENAVTAELEQLHRIDAFRPVRTENLTEKKARFARPTNVPKRKVRRVDIGT